MAEEQKNENQGQNNSQQQGNQQAEIKIDYEKIAELVSGKQNKTADSVIAGVLKQEGLSGGDLSKAIQMFKEYKAKNTPDVAQLNATIESLKKDNRASKLENLATLSALKMGVDIKTIPYLLKCAEFPDSEEVKPEEIDAAIKKVLENVPQFKTTKEDDNGFKNFGGKNSDGDDKKTSEDTLRGIFGINKK